MQSWADCITGTHVSSFWKRQHHLIGISTSIPHYIFTDLFGRSNDPEIRNPYLMAFYALISRLAQYCDAKGMREKIEFIFDYQPGSMARAEQGWNSFIKGAPKGWGDLLTTHSPSFQDDKDILPLQAADLHAGWVRTLNEAILLGRKVPEPIWGDAGDSIIRVYRNLDEAGAEKIFQMMFGYIPFKISWSLLPVWRVTAA